MTDRPEPLLWTPDMPLRADATNEQIAERTNWLADNEALDPAAIVAREFAAACVEDARRAPHPDTAIERVLCEVADLQTYRYAGSGALIQRSAVESLLRAAIDAARRET